MGNSSNKDVHGSAGAHLDSPHTPPASLLTPTVLGTHPPLSSTPAQQGETAPKAAKVTHQGGPTHARDASQSAAHEWAVISPAGTESDSGGVVDCGEAHLVCPVTALTQSALLPVLASTAEDSGLDQSAGERGRVGEGCGNRDTPTSETLLEQYRMTLGLSHGQDGPLSTADLVRCVLAERDKLADEVQYLKEVMKTERGEWLQFQADLQVAVAVADRLRVEAEEELGSLRGAHRDAEQQLALARRRQEDTDAELESLRIQYQEACNRLSSLARESPETGAQEESAVPGRWRGGECTTETDGPGSESQGTDRGRVLLKVTKREEVAVGGKGVAEEYLRSVAAESKRKEESRAGREPRKMGAATERSRSLSRLPLSSDSPFAINGNSQPVATTMGPLSKNQHTGQGKRVEQVLEQQASWTGAGTGKQEVTANHQNTIPSDLPLTAGTKVKQQDGLSMLLRRHGGSKRNSLLRWCQSRTLGYKNIDITNFSSSWADGMALCAVFHTYLPSHIPYHSLNPESKRENLDLAFRTGESVGIQASLTVEEMLKVGGPDWQGVLGYVESIYRHFEM
ncbi:cytospin-A isoform X2 [Paramormyrops kingsleyae]|uniref:cytospin-A isoform X2 n=1 Tax=Paramormyrops kingsleyae TaxID=1676925 RepID=UPI000CD60C9F|nr:cytospin-A-like isoform X2 [Paramormyrops kingsleyae]